MPRGKNSSSPVAKAARVNRQNTKALAPRATPDIVLSSDSSENEEPPTKKSRSSSSGTFNIKKKKKTKRKVTTLVLDSDLELEDAEMHPSQTHTASFASNERRDKRANSLDDDPLDLDLAEAQVEQQEQRVKKPGETVEGLRDQIVLLSTKKSPSNPQDARPVRDRQAFAQRVNDSFTGAPEVPTSPLASPAAQSLSDKVAAIRRGDALPLPRRAEKDGVAVSPNASQILTSVLNCIDNSGLRAAVERFIIESPDRIDWERAHPDQVEGGLADSINVALDEMRAHLETQTSLSSDVIDNYFDRIIVPGGRLYSRTGRFSNYPPEESLVNNHGSGINPYSWTGSRLAAKHSELSEDSLLAASSTRDKTALIGAEIRSRPQPLLDSKGGAGIAARHATDRISVDFGLLAVSERMKSGTITTFTGAQAKSMLENVSQAFEEIGELRTFKRKVTVNSLYGVKNKHGNYPDGSSTFDLTIIFSKDRGDYSIKSINFGAPQWCVGAASASNCNSASKYRCAQIIDGIESFLGMLRTGQDDASVAASNLAQAAIPLDQSKQRWKQQALATILARNGLRGLELEEGIVIPPSEIPPEIWGIHLRKGDYNVVPTSLFYDSQNGTTHLDHMCHSSKVRADETLRKQVHWDNGEKINGLQKKSRDAHKTLRLQVHYDEEKQEIINGDQKRARAGHRTLDLKICFDEDGHEITGNQERARNSHATLKSQVHSDEEGNKINGEQKKMIAARKTLALEVHYDSDENEMNGLEKRSRAAQNTMNTQVFYDSDNNKINGQQKKYRKARETCKEDTYYDSDDNEMDGNQWKKYARDATLRKTSAGQVHNLEVNKLQKISYDNNRANGLVDYLLIVSLLKTHHRKFLNADGSVDCTKFIKKMVKKGKVVIPPHRPAWSVAGSFKLWVKKSMNGKNKEGWNDAWIP
ncbi:hypothetical protein JCM5350_006094 [Sporobolomyces pararoseus]